jgi:hypothetical protein
VEKTEQVQPLQRRLPLDVTFFGRLKENFHSAQIIPNELGGLLKNAFMNTVRIMLACA